MFKRTVQLKRNASKLYRSVLMDELGVICADYVKEHTEIRLVLAMDVLLNIIFV